MRWNLFASSMFLLCLWACGSPGDPPVRADPMVFGDDYRETQQWLGGRSEGVLLRTFTPKNKQDGLFVYVMGGGPNGLSYSEPLIRNTWRIYKDLRPTIHFVEYAGSRCCDGVLEQRLERGGLPELANDAALISEYIDSSPVGTVHIIHSASFSTPVNLLINARRAWYDERCVHPVYVSPWINYYGTEFIYDPANKGLPDVGKKIEERKSSWRTMAMRYLHINEDLLSDPSREWLASVRDLYNPKVRSLVILPQYENRSDRDELIAFFDPPSTTEVFLSGWSHHETVANLDRTIDVTRTFVERHGDPAACLARVERQREQEGGTKGAPPRRL